MKIDLNLQKYIDWEVSPVMPLKGKYGYRVFLKYMDGSAKVQQKSGFETDKEANMAREQTIGELYSGKYIVYANIRMKEFLELWIEEDIKIRVGSYETYVTFKAQRYSFGSIKVALPVFSHRNLFKNAAVSNHTSFFILNLLFVSL